MIRVTFSRWPWQWYVRPESKRVHNPQGVRYGWTPNAATPFSRFGGGWEWKLGIAFSGKTIMVDLLFGIVTITWAKKVSR